MTLTLVSINVPFLTRILSPLGPSSSAVLIVETVKEAVTPFLEQHSTGYFLKHYAGVPDPEDPLCFSDGDVA